MSQIKTVLFIITALFLLVFTIYFACADTPIFPAGGDDRVIIGTQYGHNLWIPTAAPTGPAGGSGGSGGGPPSLSPYDLTIDVPPTSKPATLMPVTITLTNTGPLRTEDVTLTWYLTDPANTTWDTHTQSVLVPPGLKVLNKTLYVPAGAVLGVWTAHAQVQPPSFTPASASDTFQVTTNNYWWLVVAALTITGGILIGIWRKKVRDTKKSETAEPALDIPTSP